jgi:glycosyltransferase involved in cell wall biosynthesis
MAWRSRCWDAVVSHWLVPSGLIAGGVNVRGIPHLAIAHSGDVHLLRKVPGGALLARRISRHADVVGFVSAQLKAEFAALLPDVRLPHHRVLPMGYFAEDFVADAPREQIRLEMGIENTAVLFLGRMVPIKGLDVLIRALTGMNDVTLVAAGDGQERAVLIAAAQQAGVQALFPGRVDPRQRARLLSACDVLVVPSRQTPSGRHEGMPLAVLEGLAAGIPVIASRTGAIDALIAHGRNGLLVDPDDPVALGRAVQYIVHHPEIATQFALAGTAVAASRRWDVLSGDILAALFDR